MKGALICSARRKALVAASASLARLKARRERLGDGQRGVGAEERAQHLPVLVGEEEQQRRGQRDQRGEGRQRLGILDGRARHVAEADEHGGRRRHELQREEEQRGPSGRSARRRRSPRR